MSATLLKRYLHGVNPRNDFKAIEILGKEHGDVRKDDSAHKLQPSKQHPHPAKSTALATIIVEMSN